jgi:deoxyribonuclease IV
MPKIGAHVSAAVSLDLALDRAKAIGAECCQIFVSPPRQWAMLEHTDSEISQFKKKKEEWGIGPNFIHGTYLVSLGTDNPEQLEKSIEWLKYALRMADQLNCRGVIFHMGSHKGRGFETVKEQVVESLKQVLATVISNDSEKSPDNRKAQSQSGDLSATPQSVDMIVATPRDDTIDGLPLLILENSAGGGGSISPSFHELGQLIKAVQNPRLKICLDVQHAFGAGYDVKSLVGLKDVLAEFDEEIGLENLAAIHANDSKVEYKSNRDRHENIGEGFIGREGFENMLNDPSLKEVPFLLEVPGFAGNGPDKENVEIMKKLRK